MCTVTFLPRRRGYALAMNRDEKLTRIKGLPPSRRVTNGRAVLAPSEPSGGTWIALNDSGATFALINWYLVPARIKGSPVSRGEVVNAVHLADSPATASALLAKLPLKKINAFRLVGIFSATQEVVQWQWNLKNLVPQKHPWRAQQWISSGFDEPAAQRVRSKTFRQMLKQKSAGSLDWLQRLHRSHSPQSGPFSTCMHRDEAATVSYTEVVVSLNAAWMHHHAGAPCQSQCQKATSSSAPLSCHLELAEQSHLPKPSHREIVEGNLDTSKAAESAAGHRRFFRPLISPF